jgi:hypothetical protein
MSRSLEGTARFLKRWPQALAFLCFLFLGASVLPYPGIQNDEVFFAGPIYQTAGVLYTVRLHHHNVTVMLLSYLGALKTWLYIPILSRWRPSIYSVRWPVLLLSAATVILLFYLAKRIHSERAAIFAVLLLATDSSYILTSVFDWGPVVLQHLILLCSIAFLWRFAQGNRPLDLGLGSFFLGLGLWDKALFLWPLGGIIVAAAAVLPRQIWLRFSRRNLTLALTGFLVGACPLIQYNRTHHWDTFRTNSHFTFKDLYAKSTVLEHTADGSALFGYLVNDSNAGHPLEPVTFRERVSAWVNARSGPWRASLFPWIFLASFFLLPWLWSTRARRPMLFLLIAIAIGWFQMAITQNAGGSVHHTILLWPMPALFVALALAELSWRGRIGAWAAGLAMTVLLIANLLNFNQYLVQFARYGAAGSWDDGILTLSKRAPDYHARQLYVTDWGILTPLLVLHRGSLPLEMATDALMSDQPAAGDLTIERLKLQRPDALWLGHTGGQEQFQGVGARLDRIAASIGLRKQIVDTIADRNGRPVLEVFRFVPSS